jgi:hypothetical protein
MFNGGEFSKILDDIFEKDDKEKETAIKIYCKIWEYLENITLQNLKYKRAFEILKDMLYLDVEYDGVNAPTLYVANDELTDYDLTLEEAELLEELMKGE